MLAWSPRIRSCLITKLCYKKTCWLKHPPLCWSNLYIRSESIPHILGTEPLSDAIALTHHIDMAKCSNGRAHHLGENIILNVPSDRLEHYNYRFECSPTPSLPHGTTDVVPLRPTITIWSRYSQSEHVVQSWDNGLTTHRAFRLIVRCSFWHPKPSRLSSRKRRMANEALFRRHM